MKNRYKAKNKNINCKIILNKINNSWEYIIYISIYTSKYIKKDANKKNTHKIEKMININIDIYIYIINSPI